MSPELLVEKEKISEKKSLEKIKRIVLGFINQEGNVIKKDTREDVETTLSFLDGPEEEITDILQLKEISNLMGSRLTHLHQQKKLESSEEIFRLEDERKTLNAYIEKAMEKYNNV
jgi:hypothetical protein